MIANKAFKIKFIFYLDTENKLRTFKVVLKTEFCSRKNSTNCFWKQKLFFENCFRKHFQTSPKPLLYFLSFFFLFVGPLCLLEFGIYLIKGGKQGQSTQTFFFFPSFFSFLLYTSYTIHFLSFFEGFVILHPFVQTLILVSYQC